jgi:hypothetical protein
VHDATPVGPVVAVLQLVVTQEFDELGATGAQEATPVGPVLTVLQVVAV